MSDILREVIRRNRAGAAVAIPSICSAHPDVLEATLRLAADKGRPVVIEATSNQVNQDGGYTGMRPADFIGFVHAIADRAGLDAAAVIFGGDHLGPQVWRQGPAPVAMERARVLVADYVRAGFRKIHLDCSEGCAGEPAQLGDALAAARAADLAVAALAASTAPDGLMFVIGTEVPPPGGARADDGGNIPPTTQASAAATLAAHADAFRAAGIGSAIAQIGGLVVQPGVEFSPMHVHHLPLHRDPGFLAEMGKWPQLCLEAHSTDYQHPAVFPRLAALGFAFQKVGPALTFAYRSALYALDSLRQQAGWGGGLVTAMEAVMLADPRHWQGHYHAESGDLRVQRHFGLADRIRYYWPQAAAQAAVGDLFAALKDRSLPCPVLAQGFSAAEIDTAARIGGDLPRALVLARIQMALDPYFFREDLG